jgi:phosphoglycolate phosphatase
MALPPLRYQAVLFDLDGTLVDSYAALAEAVNFARREHGLPELSAARIRDFAGDGGGMKRLSRRESGGRA